MSPTKKKQGEHTGEGSRKNQPVVKISETPGPQKPVEELEKESFQASRNGRPAPEKDL
ncbi:MAG: hypothetical protein PW734_07550 [Verrucomicrobium sp.]|nr:hypothetical protein [Verrucomicrobium sp.]